MLFRNQLSSLKRQNKRCTETNNKEKIVEYIVPRMTYMNF